MHAVLIGVYGSCVWLISIFVGVLLAGVVHSWCMDLKCVWD